MTLVFRSNRIVLILLSTYLIAPPPHPHPVGFNSTCSWHAMTIPIRWFWRTAGSSNESISRRVLQLLHIYWVMCVEIPQILFPPLPEILPTYKGRYEWTFTEMRVSYLTNDNFHSNITDLNHETRFFIKVSIFVSRSSFQIIIITTVRCFIESNRESQVASSAKFPYLFQGLDFN